LIFSGRNKTVKLSRKILSGAQAKSPGSAASQNRDAFLSRLFVTNDGAAIAPNVYAVFVMQIKVCAKENRDTNQRRNDRSCELAEFWFQNFFWLGNVTQRQTMLVARETIFYSHLASAG